MLRNTCCCHIIRYLIRITFLGRHTETKDIDCYLIIWLLILLTVVFYQNHMRLKIRNVKS